MAEVKEPKTLKDRQKALEARKAAREERRKSQEAAKAAQRAEIDQMIEEQMEDVEDIREDLETKGENSELLIYKTDHGVVAVQPPKAYIMARFRKEMNKRKSDLMKATDVLVLDCLKYPTRPEYEAIVKEKPLLPESIGSDLIQASGGSAEAEVKKS